LTSVGKDGPAKKPRSISVDNESFGFRIKTEMRRELELIAQYEGKLNASELARAWVSAKVTEYRGDPLYRAWLKKWNSDTPPKEQTQLAVEEAHGTGYD
jgi:hypothetical protein